jgi:hypothetical protein
MKIHFAALIVVVLGAASNMMASSIVALPTGPQNFTYDLSLPSITVSGGNATENDSTHFDIQFSWLGQEMYNAGEGTACPLGCPVDGTTPGSPAAGFSFHDFAFTASTSEDCALTPTGGCGEALVTFQNGGGDEIVYSLIEPDLFWSTSGLHTFAAGDGVGSGASWIYQTAPAIPGGTSELPGDPPCTSCSVTTSQSPAAPEPGTWLLLTSGLGAAMFVSRRRRSVSVR